MLSRRITFVLGAGASAELGFPLGSDLQRTIQHQASNEHGSLSPRSNLEELSNILPLSRAMSQMNYDWAQTKSALLRLHEGIVEAPSIDTFLHNNKQSRAVVDCGKLAIVHAILAAEAESPVYSEDAAVVLNGKRDIPPWKHVSHRSAALGSSFISVIWNEICQPHTREDVQAIFDNIAFVNFNYDRSLEEAFTYKLMTTFGLEETTAREIVDKLEVVRPYGSPHGAISFSSADPPFGERYTSNLCECAERIRTFTEAAHDDVPERIKALMTSSNTVVFLGFGFHQQNIDLFASDGNAAPLVYFSLFGGSDENSLHIERMIKARIGRIANGKASTSAEYRYHLGSSIDTLRRFQFPIFRSR